MWHYIVVSLPTPIGIKDAFLFLVNISTMRFVTQSWYLLQLSFKHIAQTFLASHSNIEAGLDIASFPVFEMGRKDGPFGPPKQRLTGDLC